MVEFPNPMISSVETQLFLQKSVDFSKKLLTNCDNAIIIIKALVKGF